MEGVEGGEGGEGEEGGRGVEGDAGARVAMVQVPVCEQKVIKKSVTGVQCWA